MYNLLFKVFLSLVSISYIFLLIFNYKNYHNLIIGNAICVTVLSNLISLYFLVPEKILEKYIACAILLIIIMTSGIGIESSIALVIICSDLENKWSTYGFIIYSSWIYLIGIFIYVYYKFTYEIIQTRPTNIEYTELQA
jgi:hypothetical protein